MKYKPLDLSFIAARAAPEINNIQNTAQMIMANAGWSQPSQGTLRSIAKAQKAAAAAHKPTFLSSVFDLLSTPLYGLTNALDKSIAAHQSDNSDSVVEDIGKTIGGVFTGAGRGLGAGLRGASGILDVLPGVDISDDWQTDPTDKTHFSDVNLRLATGMSSKDATDPANWAKALTKARKEKGEVPDFLGDLFYGNLDQPNDQDSMKSLFKHLGITGVLEDIGGDPLNYVLPGSGASKAATATKGLTEGLETARASGDASNTILNALKLKSPKEVQFKGPIDMPAPIAAIGEGAPKAGVPIDIKSIGALGEKGNFKTLAQLGRKEGPKQGLEVSTFDQRNLTKRIANLAGQGEKGWLYKAADLLREHPTVKWAKTEEFLQKADAAHRAKKLPHRPDKMAPVLLARISEDVANSRKAAPAERRLTNEITDVVLRGALRNSMKRSEAVLANRVVRKFEGEILGKVKAPGTGEALARAISEGRNVRYSGPQQARMWNQITSNLKYGDARKFDKATRVLRAVEDYFIGKGVIPHSSAKTAESVPLRLSDVAQAIGPQILGKSHAFITGILRGDPKALSHLTPEELEKLRDLRANEAMVTAPAVQRGIDAGLKLVDDASKLTLSAGRKKPIVNQATKLAGITTARFGGGDVGSHVAKQYIGNIIGKSDPINAALNANRLKTEAWLSKTGRGMVSVANDPDFVNSVTRAISEAANLPTPKQLSGLTGAAARVADWLGARFNAAYGVQDMHPIFLREQSSAMSTSARRAKLINNLARTFPPSDADLWHEAFRTAQMNGIADGRVAELQSEIAEAMENLFGGTGLRSGAIADSTVVGRNRILLDELNKNLKRFGLGQYEFTAKKVTDAAGIEHDFTKGLDWMKSWEAWDVKKPYEFLHKIQMVTEFTVREKNMFDEIVSRFASDVKSGSVKYGVNHPRLQGYFFTEEGARQAQVFVKALEEVSTPNSKALQHFDHVLSKLKASLTIYIPGHHWTNMIGDVYFNWIAGVNKPIRYDQAMKVMLAQKGRYGDFASFESLAGPKALEQAIARSVLGEGGARTAGIKIPAAGTKTIVTMKNGTKVTADMLYTAAFREGILPSARVLEDVTTETSSVLDKIGLPGKARGTVQRGVHQVSEVRDHIPRLAQFIDGIAKSSGSFGNAVSASARSVRKWHPDGLDLTKFERTGLKRVFPFYSWTRKAIPLAIESALVAGPKVMAYPRLMEVLAQANGIESQAGTTDPFPTDQMFPDWLRERGIGPIVGGPGNYGVVNPSTPVLDTLALLGKPGQSSIDMLNPMIKTPIEVGQGQTLGRNIPIQDTNQGWLDYATKQIPVASQVGRASGQFGVSDSTRAEGFPNWTNILNLLTGAKKVDSGKYQKSAQFDLRDYLKKRRAE